MNSTNEPAVHNLRARGYRLTPQRLAILRALRGSNSHPSAEAIHQQLSSDFPSMSLATVYKTLAMLKELGGILELEVNGCSRYDGNIAAHPHLICEKCHAILDLPANEAPLPHEALARAGFQARRSQLIIYGLCAACQKEPAAAQDERSSV